MFNLTPGTDPIIQQKTPSFTALYRKGRVFHVSAFARPSEKSTKELHSQPQLAGHVLNMILKRSTS